MEKEELKNVEVYVKTCPECESGMTVNQTCEYEVIFRPEITALVHKISEKVKNLPHKIHYKFASMDCLNLCAAKEMSNEMIEHLVREGDPNSLLLIQQLSEKLTSKSDDDLTCPGKHKICMVCGLKFKSTRVTLTHFTIRHPEYLALVQFLRRHPLSELKFGKDVVALSRTKTRELLTQITNPAVLATCQSFAVSNALSAEEMKKIKKVVENSSYPDKNNIAVVLVPKKCLTTSLKNSERDASSGKESDKNATATSPGKIIQFGVEDLKREQLRRQQEKEEIKKKEEILHKKVFAKYNEKEIKKKVLYWQKKLTRYVVEHQKLLFKLVHDLTTARYLGTSNRYRVRLLEKVCFYVKNEKVKKNVTYLLKKLFETMGKVNTVKTNKKLSNADSSSSENSPEKVDKSPKGKIQNYSTFKGGKNKECSTSSFAFKETPAAFISPSVSKLTLASADSHTVTTLITDDKQLVECSCGKLNCQGLHPENFY